MTLLNAAALGLLGLAVPLVLLYILKMKRHERTVSSTVLWQKVITDIQATSPFQKLQRNLLLLLQLLILGLLAFALARPTLKAAEIEGRSLALIVDLSASMKAAEAGGRSRFDLARLQALEIADNLGGSAEPGEMMIIAAGRRTRVRKGFTSDRTALRRILEELEPADTTADVREAIALAEAALKERSRPEIVLLSDGAGTTLPEIGVKFTFLRVGETAENLGLTRMDVRAAAPRTLAELRKKGELEDGRYPYQIFAAVRNFGTRPRKTFVSLLFEEELAGAREIELDAGGETTLLFKERFPPGQIEIRLDAPDALAADNSVRAFLRPADELRVALTGAPNPFLGRVLESLPYVDLHRPADPSEGRWDLVICDRVLPGALPEANLLIIAPDRDLDGYTRAGTVEYPRLVDWRKDHPLFRSVGFHDVHFSQAQKLGGETRGRVLARAEDGAPLILLSQEPGRSFRCVLTFGLSDSDWPLRPSFPIFFTNLLQYARDFNTLGTVPFHRTGAIVPLPPFGSAEVVHPSGRRTEVTRDLFSETDEAGLYRAAWGEERLMRFAVNLLDERESDIAPAAELRAGLRSIAAEARLKDINREIWPWVALLILGFALLEWWAYHWKVGH